MSDQSVVDELIAQRDRVLFDKWVNHPPRAEGEACTAFWWVGTSDDGGCNFSCLPLTADLFVRRALNDRGESVFSLIDLMKWNDHRATRQDVLDVLDEAIRLAKEST